jgi:hypothetical protein
MKSGKLSWVSTHLALAEAVLALQQEVAAIKGELALRPTPPSGRRCRPINWKGISDAMTALREVLATPAAQALTAIILPLIAAVGRWLLRWLGI